MTKKILLSTIALSSLLFSADLDITKESKLVTHTELGFIQNTGNTETTTFSLDAQAKKNWQKHVGIIKLDGQYGKDDDVETKNKFYIELQYDYDITDRFAFNYLTAYKTDKFSSYDYQYFTGPGAKYKVLISDTHNLSLEGNVLYSVDEISSVEHDANGDIIDYPNAGNTPVESASLAETDSYAAYRLKADYSWQILENLKFNQELSYRGSFEDSENYFMYSKSAFSAKISDMFSAGLSYKVDYVNQLPEFSDNSENTDTTLTANLIMDY